MKKVLHLPGMGDLCSFVIPKKIMKLVEGKVREFNKKSEERDEGDVKWTTASYIQVFMELRDMSNARDFVVYARREPTTDSATRDAYKAGGKTGEALEKAVASHFDVQVYHDKEGTKPFGRFPWDRSNKPTRRNKWLTLNCFRYRLEWIK